MTLFPQLIQPCQLQPATPHPACRPSLPYPAASWRPGWQGWQGLSHAYGRSRLQGTCRQDKGCGWSSPWGTSKVSARGPVPPLGVRALSAHCWSAPGVYSGQRAPEPVCSGSAATAPGFCEARKPPARWPRRAGHHPVPCVYLPRELGQRPRFSSGHMARLVPAGERQRTASP